MPNDETSLQAQRQAVMAVLATLLEPLARLCVAKAVTIQGVEELMRRSFVRAAREACGESKADRIGSRISTMTGLTRREVSRIDLAPTMELPATRSPAIDLVTLWLSLPGYTDPQGRPISLPRAGLAPSFEALAASVTRDVHPRSLLAELIRLRTVAHDPDSDRLTVLEEAFVPRTDWPRMVGFLGTNVGDHLRAAVTNVLGTGTEHFEQALLADEMSPESIQKARALITDQWRTLMTTLGPRLQALIDDDAGHKRAQTEALRVGLYSWAAPMTSMPPVREIPQSKQSEDEAER
jgi:hypothetical protein